MKKFQNNKEIRRILYKTIKRGELASAISVNWKILRFHRNRVNIFTGFLETCGLCKCAYLCQVMVK